MSLKPFLSSFLLTLLILSSVAAQSPSTLPESKEEKEKAQKELERKTLSLLDETIEGAQVFKLAENRSLVQATAGDLLWTHDEKRARALFRDAMTALGETMNNAKEKISRRDDSFWMLMHTRHQMLRMIARRDPQLALDLLHATRPASDEGAEPRSGMRDQELALEQSIAAEVAASDPKRALQMAQESLSKGVSYGLINLLHKLQQKDSEAATRFAGDIVKKLQTENFKTNHEAAYLAQNLLRAVLQPQQPSFENYVGQAPAKWKPLVLDESTTRDLADVVATAVLNSPAHVSTFMSQDILPELEKRVPARAAQLRKKVREINETLDPEQRKWMELEPLMRNGSTEAMLEAAAKAPSEMRRALYGAAAWKLLQKGDAERARQIVNDNLSGSERNHMLDEIDRRLISRAIEQGKLDEAKQLIARVRSKNSRASRLAQLAMGVAAKGDRKAALELMNDAQALISRQPENQEEINALLQVARAYATIEPARTFEMIEPMIDHANEMLAAAALLEKFGAGRGFFRKGEMVLQPGFSTVGGMYAQYAKDLAALARADFNRTKTLVDRFQRNEVRIMARLLIAQSILSDRFGIGDNFGGEAFIEGGNMLIVNEAY